MSDEVRDAGYADLLDAIAEGEGYYVECVNGHGSVPPRHVCPDCGAQELGKQSLPDEGEIETFTIIYAPLPGLVDDTPYAIAIVNFGPVRLTGYVPDHDADTVARGLKVTPDVTETETGTTADRMIVFNIQ